MPIAIRAIVLPANTTTPVIAPYDVMGLIIGNGGGSLLTVYSFDGQDDPTRALTIASGFERQFGSSAAQYDGSHPWPLVAWQNGETAFFIRSPTQCTVRLIWTASRK